MEEISHIPFFFIVGRPRSGTTLLQALFDAHPNVRIPWECQLILNLYPKYKDIEYWTEKSLLNFYHDLFHQWQFDAWNIHAEKLKSDILACQGHTSYSVICKEVYSNYISFFEKKEIKSFGDKNHGYTIYIDRLQKLFPDAKFIFITRDYRDNFCSVKNVDFELPVISLVVYKWKYFLKKFIQSSQKHPASCFIIRYEDLVSDPALHFRKLCEFVGIDFTPEVLYFYKKKEEAERIYPTDILKKHHSSLFHPITEENVGKWKKILSERAVKIADFVAGEYAELAGYKRQYEKVNLWIKVQAMPGICYGRMLYCLTAIIDKFPYRLRGKILNRGPLFLARIFLGMFNPKKLKK
jgi:hypothetical protein